MGFMDEYRKALQEEQQKSGSGSAGVSGGSSFMDEYYKVVGSVNTAPTTKNFNSFRVNEAPLSERIAARTTVGKKKKKKEEERKWFQKGLFEDGYDFGDVTKTILGIDEDSASLKELTWNSLKRGYYNSIYGEESYEAMLGNPNEKEAYEKLLESDEYQFTPGNELAGGVSGAFELGGQMIRQFTNPRTLAFTGSATAAAIIAGNAGPQALVPEEIISVPAVATAAFKASSAASNFEIEAGHAYNEMIELGIKEDIAKKIALAVGAGNAGLELFQTGDLIDAYKATGKKEATQSVAKLIVKELADRGVDVITETVQEDAQELITIGGVQAANWLDKGKFAYTAQEVGERLWDTTKSSALSFGMMNVPAAVRNTASIVSEQKKTKSLTANEQKVVDKLYNDEIANREDKLTKKEKSKIYDSIVSNMEKGYISIDTIEEVLGGKTYEDYKSASEWEDSIQKEYDELHKMKRGDMTGEQIDREAELKQHLEDAKKNGNRDILKSQLYDEVFNIAKGDRLVESYNEKVRKTQKFEADLSKYDEKQRQHIQDAIDSGVLHNGNRAHEIVDYTAKVSADTGMSIKYSNTEKIKADGLHPKRTIELQADGSTTEFDLGVNKLDEGFKPIVKVGSTEVSNYKVDFENGKITFDSAPTGDVSVTVEGTEVVDAVYTEDGIILNVESPKYLEALTGHEVGHKLELAKNYDKLKKAVISFAEAKGEWEDRLKYRESTHKGIKNANPEREAVNDLLGEYLFQGSDFIMDLSVNHRNVFQKIFDEIKYLCKVATAGSKEARRLEAVKHEFEKAYREISKMQTTTDGGVKYSTYWKPNFTKEEWTIVNRRKFSEFDNPKFELDKDKNWMYFNEKGMTGFAVYSKNDADDPTILYSSRGKKAENDYARLDAVLRGDIDASNKRANTNRTTLDGILSDILRSKRNEGNGIAPIAGGERAAGDVSIPVREPGSNGRRDFEDGTENRNAALTEYYTEEASDNSGASSLITHGSDYNAIRNFMKDDSSTDSGVRFSLSNPVEQTKDLLAVHNLTSEQVLKSLDLGGLPMPSVAVLKADSVHDEYGDVSLILPKDAIDPKANKANKVYGGDAWTPVYPRIEYKPNAKVEKKISDKYYGLAREIGYDAVRPMYNYVTDLERQLNNAGGEAAMLEKLYDDTDMMNLYLQDSGKGKIEPIQKETVTEISPEQAEMNQFFIDALGEEVISNYPTPKGENMGLHRRQFVEQHGDEIRAAYKRFFMELYDFSEAEADNAVDNTSKADLLHIVRDAYQYTQNKGVTVKTEFDSQATNEAIRSAASDGYRDWVDSLFKGVEEKTGIRNNQDYYTNSGNPRSWDALHWANTLENVVKVMKGQEETGTTSFSPYNSFASLSHKRYGSIAEIKADSNRLGKISQEEYEALGDSFAQRFIGIADSIKDPAERNPFIAVDNAAELIVDAVRNQKTKAGMLKYLQKWNKRVTEQTVEDVVALVNDIANMPTGYFEAKPQRAVSFEEVGVFVIPYDGDVKLKQELLNRGYSIAEYDPKVEGDRQRVVNQFEEYKFSLSNVGEDPVRSGYRATLGRDVALQTEDIAPTAEASEVVAENETTAPTVSKTESVEDIAPIDVAHSPVLKRLNQKLSNIKTELYENQKLREESSRSFDEKIADAKAQLEAKKNKDTKVANNLKRRIERLERLKADRDAEYAKRIGSIKSRISNIETNIQKYHPGLDRAEKAIARIDKALEADKAELTEEYNLKKEQLADKDSYISQKATELYNEIRNLKKGVRASEQLGYLLDHGYDWSSIKSALVNIKHTPGGTVNINSEAESVAREMLNEDYENSQYALEEEYLKQINELEAKADEKRKATSVAHQRKTKMEEHSKRWENIVGDTSTWKDMSIGLSYKTKTLRRILRKVVKDANGDADIQKADRIYDELETKYDHNEAQLKQESQKLKEVFFELNLNNAEDTYAHMLGELKYNPETTLTEEVVKEYYDAHKGRIDTSKVNKAITEARKTFDDLIVRVNDVLREQGMKEIPYRKGYFPHFTNPKQGWLAKLLNWKTIDNEIPTSIAGLTEMFTPQRSWQSFNKQRMGDKTDYSLYQGLDTYIHGALDWIYHIDDIQSRRALENHLRYTHSDEGVKARIEEIKANDTYDADETQKLIEGVLAEANNPLSGLVRELMNRTNTLANKKSSMDRGMEDATNRKIYSTMTNLNNRINANMVVGSFSSALTNFIPMVQSWHQVSPYFTVRGLGDFVRSSVRDDGMVAKSDFLTNRLVEEEKLYQTTWDKVSDKAAFMMNVIDNITSQTVWRSKYLQNIKEGMSEAQAIKDADQFSKNVMAGRSRGNAPTIFDAKNPLAKIFTAFQLEVANQYGYMFEDVPQDSKNTARLVKGYATAFLGAYAYNALYSSLVGRDAAFDPIGIIEDLLKDLFDDDDEEEGLSDELLNFGKSILEEVPFVGGLVGGGRVPMSSAFPYSGYTEPFESMLDDFDKKDWDSLGKEFLKPLYYLAMPVAGGQIKKTVEGLSMFSDEHPIAGSYTTSGNLRFPVEDTIGNRIKAGLFGQYASENARKYFDEEQRTLNPEQTEILAGLDIPVEEYWEYRDKYAEYQSFRNQLWDAADADDATVEDIVKSRYISSINSELNKLYKQQQEIAIGNSDNKTEDMRKLQTKMEKLISESKYAERKTIVSGIYAEVGNRRFNYNADKDLWYEIKPHTSDGSSNKFYQMEQKVTKAFGISYSEYWNNREEYDFAYEKPKKYALTQAVGGYQSYKRYSSEMYDIKADKDKNGNSIKDSRKNKVIDYINNQNDLELGERIILFKTEYPADDTYNQQIIDYLNSRDDISAQEMRSILEELEFEVDSEGYITW